MEIMASPEAIAGALLIELKIRPPDAYFNKSFLSQMIDVLASRHVYKLT